MRIKTHSQLEEACAELKQKYVWESMLVYDQHALYSASHALLLKLIAKSLKPRLHALIRLNEGVLSTECVV